ncbi:unnamed protein product [Adineta steineri]|uniref:Uncharacterized protein n=1 Tax=Adineta steineri TaxID=433720 RepID=A0A819KQH5_9BILA|nr:unnamed protein product [Adineta steineri]
MVLRPRPGAKKPGTNPENKPDEKQVIETGQVKNEVEEEGKKKEENKQDIGGRMKQVVKEKKKEKEKEKERPKSPGTNPENKSDQEQQTKTGQVKIKEVEEKKKENEKEQPKPSDAIPKNVSGQEQESEEEEDDDEEGEDYEEYDDEEEDDEEYDEETEKSYNLRTRKETHVQTPKVDSTNLVKGKTKNNEASSSIHNRPSRYRSLPIAVKPKSVCATTTDSTAGLIEPAKVQEQIEKRINYYMEDQRAVAIRYLYNKEKQLDINDLLTRLDELSAQPGSGKLLRALYKRHSPQPPFLTTRDFEDGSLKCQVQNNLAVYAVTICIPDWLYDCMREHPKLCKKKVLLKPSFDDKELLVHLCGKIGESTDFTQRESHYKNTERTGQLGPIFCYLRQKAKESEPNPFMDWVKVWPILSGKGLEDVDRNIMENKLIKMETLCSFLLGPAGNSGYNFIGRFTKATLEEMQESAKRLNKHNEGSTDDESGGRVLRKKIVQAKRKQTLSATSIGPNGLPITEQEILNQKMLEGLKVLKIREDKVERDGIHQRTATRWNRVSPAHIAEINAFVDRVELKEKPGYMPPEMVELTTGPIQYGWKAKCLQCERFYSVTKCKQKHLGRRLTQGSDKGIILNCVWRLED